MINRKATSGKPQPAKRWPVMRSPLAFFHNFPGMVAIGCPAHHDISRQQSHDKSCKVIMSHTRSVSLTWKNMKNEALSCSLPTPPSSRCSICGSFFGVLRLPPRLHFCLAPFEVLIWGQPEIQFDLCASIDPFE